MFAESDSFWKPPTVYDVAGLLGVALGIVSIWYAWFLARRQLKADLRKATDEAVERMQRLILASELADALRFLRESLAAMDDKFWLQAANRLDDAASAIARSSANPILASEIREQLAARAGTLRVLWESVRSHMRSNRNRGHIEPSIISTLMATLYEFEQLRITQMLSGNKAKLEGV